MQHCAFEFSNSIALQLHLLTTCGPAWQFLSYFALPFHTWCWDESGYEIAQPCKICHTGQPQIAIRQPKDILDLSLTFRRLRSCVSLCCNGGLIHSWMEGSEWVAKAHVSKRLEILKFAGLVSKISRFPKSILVRSFCFCMSTWLEH